MTNRSRSILLGCIALLGAGALLYWCVHTLLWSNIRSEQANVLLNSSYRPAKSKTDARLDVAEPTTVAEAEANTWFPETSQEKQKQFLCIEYVAGADAAVWAKVGAKMRGLVYQRDTVEEIAFEAIVADVCVGLKKDYLAATGMRIVLEIDSVANACIPVSENWLGKVGALEQGATETRFIASLKEFKAFSPRARTP